MFDLASSEDKCFIMYYCSNYFLPYGLVKLVSTVTRSVLRKKESPKEEFTPSHVHSGCIV